jgi:hypothetical protein
VDALSQERRMRAYSAALAAVLVGATFAQSVGAQPSRFDGAWKSLGGHAVAPDTSYDIPAFTGLAVIHGRYISQTFAPQPPNGIQQAGELKEVDAKAARLDAVIASAGTIDIHETTFVVHFLQAQASSLVGQSITRGYAFHDDTLLITQVYPWEKDKTKLVHETLLFLRLPPKPQSPLDGVWRHLTTDFTSPDTSYHRSAARGLLVIHGSYYSRIFAFEPKTGPGRAHDPADAQAKAARYDALIANAGTLTVDAEVLTQHVEEGIHVDDAGDSTPWHYRLHGDTLFTTGTVPSPKDSTKVGRLSVNFVRVR